MLQHSIVGLTANEDAAARGAVCHALGITLAVAGLGAETLVGDALQFARHAVDLYVPHMEPGLRIAVVDHSIAAVTHGGYAAVAAGEYAVTSQAARLMSHGRLHQEEQQEHKPHHRVSSVCHLMIV